MTEELVVKDKNVLSNTTGIFNSIVSRETEGICFHTFNEDSIAKISKEMPEINRVVRTLGRSNTQTTNKLMTLTMLNGNSSPYRHLRQCVTQIEDRRTALASNMKTLNEAKIIIEKYEEEIKLLREELSLIESITNTVNDEILLMECKKKLLKIKTKIKLKENDLSYKRANIVDSMCYVEGCLKDIASFQEAYNQIKESNNIPDNWDEVDAENAEIPFHIKEIFLHAYRDMLVHRGIGMGTIEYMNQFGIHPNAAAAEVITYINNTDKIIQESGYLPDSNDLENWLTKMVDKYKDEYKKVLKTMGITEMVTDWYQYKDRNKSIEE